jgi:WD40 repeat protein
VVTASDDTVSVWDVTTSRQVAHFAHQGSVDSVAFNASGTRLVTSSDDETAEVWAAATGTSVTSPLAHNEVVKRAVFSADGAWVLTTSKDHTAWVWDASTGKPITRPLPHPSEVLDAVFSADRTQVLTTSADGVRVWDVRADNTTLDQWKAVANRDPFILVDRVLSLR